MNFIVRAEDALEVVKAYFDKLPKGDSSCAGISIFHSHAPYLEAYKIAEECCESGKKVMKKYNEKNTCYVDYQFCQSGLGRELEDIREIEVGDLISKPWLLMDNDINVEKMGNIRKDVFTLDEVDIIVGDLNKLASRSNVKVLLRRAKSSQIDFDMEMDRIYAHQTSSIRDEVKYTFVEMAKDAERREKRKKLIYDIVVAYDIWFKNEEKTTNNEEKG